MIKELSDEDQPSLVKVLKDYEHDLRATAQSQMTTSLATATSEEMRPQGVHSSPPCGQSVASADSEGSLHYLQGISQFRFQGSNESGDEARTKRISELMNEMDSSYQNLKVLAVNAKSRATELDSVIKRTEAKISSVIAIAESRGRIQKDKNWAVLQVSRTAPTSQDDNSASQSVLGPQLGNSMHSHATPQGASSSGSFTAASTGASTTQSSSTENTTGSGHGVSLPIGPSPIAPRRYQDSSFEGSLQETSMEFDEDVKSSVLCPDLPDEEQKPRHPEIQTSNQENLVDRSPLLSPTTQTKHEILESMSCGPEGLPRRREAVEVDFEGHESRSILAFCVQLFCAMILYLLIGFAFCAFTGLIVDTPPGEYAMRLEQIRHRVSEGVVALNISHIPQQFETQRIQQCGLAVKDAGIEIAVDVYLILADAFGSCAPSWHEMIFGPGVRLPQLSDFRSSEDQLDSWGMLF